MLGKQFILSLCLCILCSTPLQARNIVQDTQIELWQQRLSRLGVRPTPYFIVVDSSQQSLTLFEGRRVRQQYVISTSKFGLGQEIHSFKTPTGLHRINEKIGAGVPLHGIFKHRRYLNMTWQPVPRQYHTKDYISTRILRLEGLEPGLNRGRDNKGRMVDSQERVVYIHGTTREWELGTPSTKGCVHMGASDIRDLFEAVPVGTLVAIL